MTTILETFKRARSRCVPIIGIETPDPAASVSWLLKAEADRMNGKLKKTPDADGEALPPVLLWDCMQGLTGRTPAGESLAQELQSEMPLLNPSEMLSKAPQMPKKTILIMSNAQRFISNETVMQGVWNCRDTFAKTSKTLILFGPQIKLPPELTQDCIVLTEELPGETELSKIAETTVKNAKLEPSEVIQDKKLVVDTLRGLSSFAAEQVTALSLTKSGYDMESLWQRKAKMIEQTPGLAVWKGTESFNDIGGLSNLKGYLRDILTSGKTPIRAIGFIDEIEKGFAGAGGDTSGTSQDQIAVFLKVMQDYELTGIILLGHGGTGKSMIAKAAGNLAKCPTIAIDPGAMKDSLVGSSEARIRGAMEVFKAVSMGDSGKPQGMFIVTCNKIAALPPELRRRFTLGTFFVDLPDEEEQKTIWPIWLKKYALDANQDKPNCAGWTGAEIRACCDTAYRTNRTLKEAAKFVVPVIKSAPEQVQTLRKLAHNSFISASYEGTFDMKRGTQPEQTGERRIEV